MMYGGGSDTRRWVRIGALCWAVLAIVFSLSMGLRAVSFGQPFITSWWNISNAVLMTAVGAALTPLAIVAFQRGPGEPTSRARAVWMYVAIGVAYWLAWAVIVAGLSRVGLIRPAGLTLTGAIIIMAYISLAAYAVLVMLYEAVRSLRQAREKELESARLQSQLSRAQADALRARLNPAFLFDTMATAGTLMERDPRGARTVLADLGALLRASLGQDGDDMVSCKDELDLVQRYLDILRARPGLALRVDMETDPAAAACRLPPLVLQPVVDEVARRGLAGDADRLGVAVRVTCVVGELRLHVVATGPGFQVPAEPTDNGIAATRTRLRAVYGDLAALTPVRTLPDGVEVEIRVPQAEEHVPYDR